MSIQEGPAFSAVIVGGGIGYLLFDKTANLPMSIAVGLAIAVADYVLLVWIRSFKK